MSSNSTPSSCGSAPIQPRLSKMAESSYLLYATFTHALHAMRSNAASLSIHGFPFRMKERKLDFQRKKQATRMLKKCQPKGGNIGREKRKYFAPQTLTST